MVQVIQGVPERPSLGQTLAAGLGAGLGEGFADVAKMSLAQKMEALSDQRKMQQQQQMRLQQSQELEKMGMPLTARLTRANFGTTEIQRLAMEYPELADELMGAMQMADQQLPAGMAETPTGQPEIPPDEESMAPVDERPLTEERPTESRRKTFEEFLPPNYERLGKTAKEKAEKAAERRYNAYMQERKAGLQEAEMTRKEKAALRKEQAPYLKSIRESMDKVRKTDISLNNAEKIIKSKRVGPLPSTVGLVKAENRAARAALDTYNSGIVGFYKDIFPRLTEREFSHIEEHWTLKPTNTQAANQAIIDSHREMSGFIKKKAALVNKYMREDGSLPQNIENIVERELGAEEQKIKDTLLARVPQGTVATAQDVRNVAEELETRDPAIIRKTMEDRGFTVPR